MPESKQRRMRNRNLRRLCSIYPVYCAPDFTDLRLSVVSCIPDMRLIHCDVRLVWQASVSRSGGLHGRVRCQHLICAVCFQGAKYDQAMALRTIIGQYMERWSYFRETRRRSTSSQCDGTCNNVKDEVKPTRDRKRKLTRLNLGCLCVRASGQGDPVLLDSTTSDIRDRH